MEYPSSTIPSKNNEHCDKRLLRILCIHGYRQNSQTFREKTGSFRKLTKKVAELVYVTAPNLIPLDVNGKTTTSDDRGWWFSREDEYFMASDYSECSRGFSQSLAHLRTVFRDQGPFDGILGFSQGATMAALLAVVMETEQDYVVKFRFAVMVAGFLSRSSSHSLLHAHRIACPTLHVFGDTDQVIPREMSEDLAATCLQTTILQHPGGHFIPTAAPQKAVYLDFFKRMTELCCIT